ncbi:hypothetical protein SO802_010098 [Lithocarpus litseifolius]|uniref:Aminotransferase-like plant mobile domain-containing protein n=1 Tax=Lithocarpus litseifolius TaxID=425828 RepID=A0AAW2DHP4_9ROSI
MEAGPLARRWKGPKSMTEHATHVLVAYRASLSSIRAHQVVWEPYRDVLDSLPPYCTAGRHIWRAIVPLIYFWIVEEHHPKRVFRRFGMKQAPPEIVDTSVDLHRISLQDGNTAYLVAYMESYRRMTRRYITRESAYWDMLVESNVASLLQCELGSELYNQLLRTLDLVGELSRVQLENARAASEASTQATGHGGSGGRGGVGGRRGGCGPAPVRNSEDEHESDDEAFDGDWDMYMDGVRSSRCMSDAAA